jgi:hypothetical protein
MRLKYAEICLVDNVPEYGAENNRDQRKQQEYSEN